MISSEEQARAWLQESLGVSRETLAKLDVFATLLREENERQNLVARSTLDSVWVRHIADSAQLLLQAAGSAAAWLDLGSGAGFPGLVVALLHQGPVTLVESRKLRIDFLQRASSALGLSPTIQPMRVERLPPAPFDVITARAFASAPQTLALAHAFSTEKTRWILPKGRSAASELEAARLAWQGEFRLAPSLTDPEASIIIAERVRPRHAARRRREPQ
jgi:16S rRNA (guanine527-N7)-methyltransferase